MSTALGATHTRNPHAIDGDFVRDQLALRSLALNEKRLIPDGEFVLYWMQSTHRLADNWALRLATREADRLGRPLIVHQGLDPTYPHASDRIHDFILRGARDTAAHAESLGIAYHFVLRRRRDDDRRALDRLAARAMLVVTDLLPTAGVLDRSRRFAERTPCRVVAVDSYATVPSGAIPKEEYAARTIRPKLFKLLAHAIEPVEERAPRHAPKPALLRSLELEPLDVGHADIVAEIARCEIDHSVATVTLPAGRPAALERLDAFCQRDLARYADRRGEPADERGTSRLSPYLHFGMISSAEVARAAIARSKGAHRDAFLEELVTWRDLAFNFTLRNARHAQLRALPTWVLESMARHRDDAREVTYSLRALEDAATHDGLWNAGQRELVQSGWMHNAVRMLWGKSVLTWTRRYGDALRWLLHLNDKYALDGRDPASVANIQWCFGKFDRPFAERPVWGTIRPMSLARARRKFDADAYIARWSA